MHTARTLAIGTLLAAAAIAQDRITLNNGDVLTGQIKSMAAGKLVIVSPAIGEVTVPFGNVTNITTAAPIDLLTTQGELLKRRIAGIDDGQLRLEGEGPTPVALPLLDLAQLNPPPKVPEHWTGSLTVGANLATGN